MNVRLKKNIRIYFLRLLGDLKYIFIFFFNIVISDSSRVLLKIVCLNVRAICVAWSYRVCSYSSLRAHINKYFMNAKEFPFSIFIVVYLCVAKCLVEQNFLILFSFEFQRERLVVNGYFLTMIRLIRSTSNKVEL